MADTNFAETISEDLDVIDRRLIDRLQRAIPLTSRPWDEVGETLGLRGDEVLARLRRLCEQCVGLEEQLAVVHTIPELFGDAF